MSEKFSPKYSARVFNKDWNVFTVLQFFGIPLTDRNIIDYFVEMYEFARVNPNHKFYD